jgi:SsrA-binding protein
LIPLKMYIKRGFIKLLVGLCKGRKQYDKKRREKERTLKRDLHEKKRRFMV